MMMIMIMFSITVMVKSLVEYGVGEFIVIDCWSFFSIDNL